MTFDGFFKELFKFSRNQRHLFAHYLDQIDYLDDLLIDGKTPRHFTANWFALKKDLAHMDRTFSRNQFVLEELSEDLSSSLDKQKKIASIIAHLESDKRSCQSGLGKLESLFHYFNALRSERMNKNIYLLALVSGVFLPLNLIAVSYTHLTLPTRS